MPAPTSTSYRYPDYSNLMLSPPERHSDGMVDVLGDRGANRFGVLPLQYEMYPWGGKTGWRLFKCHCGEEYYCKKSHSQTAGCGKCGRPGGGTRLDLIGKRTGALEVVGHERGLGWKVKCACGRERHIMNSTMLASGGYKTCGQCTEEERRSGASAASIAPPSSLRDAVVAANKPPEDWGLRIENAPNNPAILTMDSFCETDDHPEIAYRKVDNDDGCPLCMAMARIELLEEEAAC